MGAPRGARSRWLTWRSCLLAHVENGRNMTSSKCQIATCKRGKSGGLSGGSRGDLPRANVGKIINFGGYTPFTWGDASHEARPISGCPTHGMFSFSNEGRFLRCRSEVEQKSIPSQPSLSPPKRCVSSVDCELITLSSGDSTDLSRVVGSTPSPLPALARPPGPPYELTTCYRYRTAHLAPLLRRALSGAPLASILTLVFTHGLGEAVPPCAYSPPTAGVRSPGMKPPAGSGL